MTPANDGELIKSLQILYDNCNCRKNCVGCVFWRKFRIADEEEATCIMTDKLNEALQ